MIGKPAKVMEFENFVSQVWKSYGKMIDVHYVLEIAWIFVHYLFFQLKANVNFLII